MSLNTVTACGCNTFLVSSSFSETWSCSTYLSDKVPSDRFGPVIEGQQNVVLNKEHNPASQTKDERHPTIKYHKWKNPQFNELKGIQDHNHDLADFVLNQHVILHNEHVRLKIENPGCNSRCVYRYFHNGVHYALGCQRVKGRQEKNILILNYCHHILCHFVGSNYLNAYRAKTLSYIVRDSHLPPFNQMLCK